MKQGSGYLIALGLLIFAGLSVVGITAFVQCWPESFWYGERLILAWLTGACA